MLYACRIKVATVHSLVQAARSIAPRVEVCEARPDDGVHDDVARKQCVDALQEVGVGCSARTRIHTAHKYALAHTQTVARVHIRNNGTLYYRRLGDRSVATQPTIKGCRRASTCGLSSPMSSSVLKLMTCDTACTPLSVRDACVQLQHSSSISESTHRATDSTPSSRGRSGALKRIEPKGCSRLVSQSVGPQNEQLRATV